MNLTDANDRYHRDSAFKSLVDYMMGMAMRLDFSPGELREAAVFAEITIQRMRLPQQHIFPTSG